MGVLDRDAKRLFIDSQNNVIISWELSLLMAVTVKEMEECDSFRQAARLCKKWDVRMQFRCTKRGKLIDLDRQSTFLKSSQEFILKISGLDTDRKQDKTGTIRYLESTEHGKKVQKLMHSKQFFR